MGYRVEGDNDRIPGGKAQTAATAGEAITRRDAMRPYSKRVTVVDESTGRTLGDADLFFAHQQEQAAARQKFRNRNA